MKPILVCFVELLLLNPALTLSHWPILRDISLKYYLHNRTLNGRTLLPRVRGDIVPHLLKRGARLTQGATKLLCPQTALSHPPQAHTEELDLSCQVRTISLGRAVRVLCVRRRKSPQVQGTPALEHLKMRGCLELPDGSVGEKVPVGVSCICRVWDHKMPSVSFESGVDTVTGSWT